MDATAGGPEAWPWQTPAARKLAAAAQQIFMEGPPPGHWHGGGRRRAHARPVGFGGGSFAAPWFAGPPPRGVRRSRPGDVRLAVLTLLAEQPMHGYQIITELANRSGGAWQPSPGSIYPTLQQLADEGLVTSAESDGRRTFALTDAGRAALKHASAGRRAPWEDMAEDVDEDVALLRERAGQVMAAVMQVAAAGGAQQLERAEKLLRDCRRALYRLLAEDEPDDEEET